MNNQISQSSQIAQSSEVQTVETIGQIDPVDLPVAWMPPIPPSSSGFVLCIYAVTATAGLFRATAELIRAWRDQDQDQDHDS